MKKQTVLSRLTITGFIVGIIFSGCSSPAEKVQNAKEKVAAANEDVAEANRELNTAQYDSVAQFKKEQEQKISANEKSIADFKSRIASEKMVDKAKYEKQVADLDQKNGDMRKKLADFKQEGKDNWVAFKKEFGHDMDDLGKSLKNFVVSSKK